MKVIKAFFIRNPLTGSSSLTRPIILLSILILGTTFFVFFVPIVSVSQSCRNPGCGGPEYESLGYVLTGVGETLFFVTPNPPYGQVAVALIIFFPAAIALGIFVAAWQFRKREPVNPE